MSTDFNKLMLTHYTDNTIHITPAEKHTIEQAITSVTDDVTLIQADYGEVGFLLSEIITSGTVIADFIDAEKVATNKLLAAAIEATFLYAQHAELEMLNVVSLFANYATLENLTAYRAEVEVLLADFIRADQAIIGSLTVDEVFARVAEVFELLSFQITSEGVSSIKVTSEQLVVSDGFITDAMILSLAADKIKTGTIYTNLVNIQSESGNLLISDNTIQIKDSASTPRVQVGKDANADYNMYVWDVNGNLMFDATGIHADGIKQPIIRNDMVSETANISGSKLNIDSVVTEINDGTTTLKASKVLFDETEQTLDISFKTLSDLTDDLNSEVTAQGTAINVLQGQITNKVWQTDINTSVSPLNTKITTLTNNYSTLDQTVGSISATVTSHTSTIDTLQSGVSDLSSRISTAELSITPDAIVSTVKSNLTGNDVASIINQTATTIKLQASKIKLEGLVTANSRFKILTDGSIEATDGKFTGDITGGTVTGTTLKTSNSSSRLQLDYTLRGYSDDVLRVQLYANALQFYNAVGEAQGTFYADSRNMIIMAHEADGFVRTLQIQGDMVMLTSDMGTDVWGGLSVRDIGFQTYGSENVLRGITRVESGGGAPLRLSASDSTEAANISFYKYNSTSRKGFVGFIQTNKQNLRLYSDEGNITLYNVQNQVQIGAAANHLYFPGGRKTSYSTGVDCNNLMDEWVLGSGTNFPTSINYYVHTILYDSSAQRLQLAYSYQGVNMAYMRHLRSGAWSAWTKLHT